MALYNSIRTTPFSTCYKTSQCRLISRTFHLNKETQLVDFNFQEAIIYFTCQVNHEKGFNFCRIFVEWHHMRFAKWKHKEIKKTTFTALS